jgi:hypothetical protein
LDLEHPRINTNVSVSKSTLYDLEYQKEMSEEIINDINKMRKNYCNLCGERPKQGSPYEPRCFRRSNEKNIKSLSDFYAEDKDKNKKLQHVQEKGETIQICHSPGQSYMVTYIEAFGKIDPTLKKKVYKTYLRQYLKAMNNIPGFFYRVGGEHHLFDRYDLFVELLCLEGFLECGFIGKQIPRVKVIPDRAYYYANKLIESGENWIKYNIGDVRQAEKKIEEMKKKSMSHNKGKAVVLIHRGFKLMGSMISTNSGYNYTHQYLELRLTEHDIIKKGLSLGYKDEYNDFQGGFQCDTVTFIYEGAEGTEGASKKRKGTITRGRRRKKAYDVDDLMRSLQLKF